MTVPMDLVPPVYDAVTGRLTLHRLSLAIEVRDALLDRHVVGVHVGHESTARRRALEGPAGTRAVDDVGRRDPSTSFDDHGDGRFVLRHTRTIGSTVVLRLLDARRVWVPRRLLISLEQAPGRVLSVRVHPGIAYPVPAATTGVRLRVVSGTGESIPWVRVQVFDQAARPVAWAHGDDRGEVLALVAGIGPAPATTATVPALVRIYLPPAPPDRTPPSWRPTVPGDPLTDLVVEDVLSVPAPPLAAQFLPEVLRGAAVPPGYRQDPRNQKPLLLTIGEVTDVGDVTVT